MTERPETGSRRGAAQTAGFSTSPAAERNKEPILQVLAGLLPRAGSILEIGSGTGQHVAYFAAALPGLQWQPSDLDARLLRVAAQRLEAQGLRNVATPLRLDTRELPWPIETAGAVLCINVVHIAPWSVTVGLMQGASSVLGPGAPLILYGPYKVGGRHTADSNAAFDRSLRARNAEWGVRDLDRMTELAESHGFELESSIAMPANNLIVVYRRGPETSPGQG
jgi:SAM-dependent methyltransferase